MKSWHYILGARVAMDKFAADAVFKPVAPQGLKAPSPAHTTGTKLPGVPKAPAGPSTATRSPGSTQGPASGEADALLPDALAAAAAVGGQVLNSVAAGKAATKSAGFNMGLTPKAKPAPGEISPDNGKSLYETNLNQGMDRRGLIDSAFRSVETQKSTGQIESAPGEPEL